MNNFYSDLATKGRPKEELALGYIKRLVDEEAYLVSGYDLEKDIVAPTRSLTFEVKNCQDAQVCIPIEVSCDYKPSGIVTSKSNYWMIFCKDCFIVIDAQVIKDLVKDIPETRYRIQDKMMGLKIVRISELMEGAYRVWGKRKLHS